VHPWAAAWLHSRLGGWFLLSSDGVDSRLSSGRGVHAGVVAFEQGVNGFGAEGPGEEVALAELAAELAQGGQLLGCLDAFGHRLQTERLGKGEDPRARAESSMLLATPVTKERSILRMSTGRHCR
jgi:hypothetical protein